MVGPFNFNGKPDTSLDKEQKLLIPMFRVAVYATKAYGGVEVLLLSF
jgi:hypothetical protein